MNLRRAGLTALVLGIVLLAVLPVPEFWITQLNYIGIATLAVLGLVLLTGIGGLTSFGQAFTPEPTAARTTVEIQLTALVTRRAPTPRNAWPIPPQAAEQRPRRRRRHADWWLPAHSRPSG